MPTEDTNTPSNGHTAVPLAATSRETASSYTSLRAAPHVYTDSMTAAQRARGRSPLVLLETQKPALHGDLLLQPEPTDIRKFTRVRLQKLRKSLLQLLVSAPIPKLYSVFFKLPNRK